VTASVTVTSPEKQRGGNIGFCHGAVGQDWPPAEVAAVLFFTRSRSGWDLSTVAATQRARSTDTA